MPTWVTPATYAKYGLGVFAILAVLVTVFAKGSLQAGRWPLLLVGAALALGLAMTLDLIGQRAGREIGEATARQFIVGVETKIGRGIDRRIGSQLRAVFRPRAELAGSLTEVGLSAAVLAAKDESFTDGEESPPEEDPPEASPSAL